MKYTTCRSGRNNQISLSRQSTTHNNCIGRFTIGGFAGLRLFAGSLFTGAGLRLTKLLFNYSKSTKNHPDITTTIGIK